MQHSATFKVASTKKSYLILFFCTELHKTRECLIFETDIKINNCESLGQQIREIAFALIWLAWYYPFSNPKYPNALSP
ncbi:hypothetical protein BpHYR1_050517 [Brachionus plicatilis]|uniref:Uncharacterized protein n=1 Tax=Brachionus plicatilis TaxID=10195 RepID=A0A3M7P8I7_BRAPC|nr:hypothetical protein BpHYR1_050517 [Brachionus plicatilis]